MKFLGVGWDLFGSELRNAVIQNLSTAPSSPAPTAGRLYFNTTAGSATTSTPANGNIQWTPDGTNWFSIFASASTNTASTNVFRDGSGNFSAGTITAALTGNASTATILATSRNFSINGTTTNGSTFSAATVGFNGSANVVLALNSAYIVPGDIGLTGGNVLRGSMSTATAVDTPTGNIPLSSWGAPNTDVSWGTSYKITNLADPVSAQDAATKHYVDASASGLAVKQACDFSTPSALPAYTASGSNSSHILTANSHAALVLDGSGTGSIPAMAVGMRILVYGQTADLDSGAVNSKDNGIYTVTTVGSGSVSWVLTRSSDACNSSTGTAATAITQGMFTYVVNGTVNGGNGFIQTVDNPIYIDGSGGTAVGPAFTQFSGAGEIICNSPLSKSGNTLSLLTVPYSLGGTNATTAWTQGSVLFAGASAFAQDNANFFWDASNHRLGVGTTSPQYSIDARGTISSGDGTITNVLSCYTAGSVGQVGTVSNHDLTIITNGSERWRVTAAGILQSNGAQTIQTSSGILTLTAAGGASVNVTTSATSPFIVQSSASAGTNISIYAGGVSQQAAILFGTNTGGAKWQLGKQTDESLFLYDSAASHNVLSCLTNGQTTLSSGNGSILLSCLSGNNNVQLSPSGTGSGVVTGSNNNWNFYVEGAATSDYFAVYNDTTNHLVKLSATGSSGSTLTFCSGSTETWRITTGGILQSPGAQTIQTATGSLTIATGAANGNLLLQPNGTGYVLLGNSALQSVFGTSSVSIPAPTVVITNTLGPIQLSGTDGVISGSGPWVLTTTTPAGVTANQYVGYNMVAGNIIGGITSNTATTGGSTTFTVTTWVGGTPTGSGVTWFVDTVKTGFYLDANPDTVFNKGLAINLGTATDGSTHYTSRIVHFGNSNSSVASKLQIQTHSTTNGIWNNGIFMDDSGRTMIGGTSALASSMLSVYGGIAFNGAQTIQTTTGNLTYLAGGGGNHIFNSSGVGVATFKSTSAGNTSVSFTSGTAGASAILNFYDGATLMWEVLKSTGNAWQLFDQTASANVLNFASNGAGTLSAANGNLTLSTLGSNGNILLTPNGTGYTKVTGPAQINNSLVNLNYGTWNNSTVLYYKIATLPASTSGTGDVIRIRALIEPTVPFSSNAGMYDIILSNRVASLGNYIGESYFSCQGVQSTGSSGTAAVGFMAYRESATNGDAVDVYAYFGATGEYTNLSFTVDAVVNPTGTPATIYPQPAQTTSAPTGGTVMFDTATATPVNLFSGNTTIGTVTSGTWQGSVIQPAYGGTGIAYFQVAGPTTLRTYTFPDASSTMVRTANFSIGNGSSTTITITHNWGHIQIGYVLTDTSGNVVQADIQFTTTTAVLTFLSAPTSGQYSLTIFGK